MKKKIISVFLCSIMVASMLSGCGESEKKETTENKEKVKIEFFNQKSEIKEVMDEIVKEFNALHPDIEVEQVQVPDGGNVLISRMSSGDMPDIAGIYPNESKFKEYVDSGFFMDLTGEKFLENLDSNVVESVKYNDKDYSVPLTMNAYGIFYNVDKFNELGLKVPTTWDELENTVSEIKVAGYIPFATSLKEGWTLGHLSEAVVGNAMGVDKASEFYLSDEKAENNVGFKEAMRRMEVFFDNTEEDALGTDYNTAATLFAKEEALMFPQGIWAAPVIEKAGAEFEYSMMPVPSDKAEDTKVVYGVDLAVGISETTEHPEEAKAFVEYLTQKEVAQKLHDVEKSPSVVNGVEAKNTATLGVTEYLKENNSYTWLHFEWLPSNDADWQNMVSGFAASRDFSELADTVNTVFEK